MIFGGALLPIPLLQAAVFRIDNREGQVLH
jgi:hypothetical protein